MKKATHRSFAQWKFLMAFTITMGLFAAARHAFGIEVPLLHSTPHKPTTEQSHNPIAAKPNNHTAAQRHNRIAAKLYNPIHGVWSYADCFPDIQDVQIIAAQQNGITPVSNRTEAEALVAQHQLVNISHSPLYAIDSLTHSIPYLVPQAQHLLNTICLNFIDSCHVKGLQPHLPIVTSVLRTTADVTKLQKGNKNATTNSCHCYGTTIDIAYNRFMPITGTYHPRARQLRWNEPMKQVLSEVLRDLRTEGKCYVKYERKQGCFHLTCR